MKYALLDFDGFICKAWFASKSKARTEETSPRAILTNLIDAAYVKTVEYFNAEEINMLPFVSGHTFKKDLYGDYKAHREKDAELKIFRDEMIEQYRPIKSEQLEADDLISICLDTLFMEEREHDAIVFSDDKDLKDLAVLFCKININEKIVELPNPITVRNDLYARMLAGDKEDNITGIPKVGMNTAYKLLDGKFFISEVLKIYKKKGISIDEAIKNVTLVAPIKIEYNDYPMDILFIGDNLLLGSDTVDEDIISEIVIGQANYIHKKATEVYTTND